MHGVWGSILNILDLMMQKYQDILLPLFSRMISLKLKELLAQLVVDYVPIKFKTSWSYLWHSDHYKFWWHQWFCSLLACSFCHFLEFFRCTNLRFMDGFFKKTDFWLLPNHLETLKNHFRSKKTSKYPQIQPKSASYLNLTRAEFGYFLMLKSELHR